MPEETEFIDVFKHFTNMKLALMIYISQSQTTGFVYIKIRSTEKQLSIFFYSKKMFKEKICVSLSAMIHRVCPLNKSKCVPTKKLFTYACVSCDWAQDLDSGYRPFAGIHQTQHFHHIEVG